MLPEHQTNHTDRDAIEQRSQLAKLDACSEMDVAWMMSARPTFEAWTPS